MSITQSREIVGSSVGIGGCASDGIPAARLTRRSLVKFAAAMAVTGLGIGGLARAAEASSSQLDKQARELTDYRGRTVSVPAEAQRIAILDSFSGEVAVMIGVAERLIGLPGGVVSG
ncbi:MAG: ABC transporter substrate-binding protein, partial [Coriobacteriia bacterium]|nr:ABC transporter substrate-binding protein [Coriobacteriia bacterium]